MAREVDLMRRELKKHVVPKLAALSFAGKGLEFQRQRERLDLLAIQYWKYGGVEFILEFASFDRGDLQTTWGEVVPEDKITVAHTPVLQRARLEQLGPEAGQYLRGFVFAGFGEDRSKYEALARHVASLLPQVDCWLRTGEASPHVRPLGSPSVRPVS
jgi:hypothetical protein